MSLEMKSLLTCNNAEARASIVWPEFRTNEPLVGRTGKVIRDKTSSSTVNNLSALRLCLAQTRPQRTLEVGLALGASCLTFCSYHKGEGHAGRVHVAIDPFQDSVWDGVARTLLEKYALESLVDVITLPSAIALPSLLRSAGRFQLIYIDGSHLFEDVFVDMYFSWKLLEERGYLIFDDSSDQHVGKVLRFIKSNLSRSLTQVPVPGVSPGRALVQSLTGRRQLTVFQKIGPSERNWNVPFRGF